MLFYTFVAQGELFHLSMDFDRQMTGKKDKAVKSIVTGRMTDKDFARFSEFIYKEVGIKLPPSKKTMVEARLQKRIRLLHLKNHGEYVSYLFSPQGMNEELIHLIDVVTTNTTEFFREPKHFELLMDRVLPEWHQKSRAGQPVSIWSAGCSTGMEPYTLAIVLSEFATKTTGFSFRILATDISTQALETAVSGIYDEDRIATVPNTLKVKYFLRSKDRIRRQVRVAPELRHIVEFKRLNFMEEFHLPKPMQVIFCRNVVIYFDKPTQLKLFTKLCNNLVPGGYLFIGHSESLAGMELPLTQAAPTVYKRV